LDVSRWLSGIRFGRLDDGEWFYIEVDELYFDDELLSGTWVYVCEHANVILGEYSL